MKLFIHSRGFRTKAEMLVGTKNSALLIQTLADKQTKEQNKLQIAKLLQENQILSNHNFLVACADTVFIEPRPDNKLYVSGSPHIACGFFDKDLNLYDSAFQSKGMKGYALSSTNAEYNRGILIKQDFIVGAHYTTAASTANHFFQTANNTSSSNSIFSNGKEENAIVNAGGGFYLLALKNPPCFSNFKERVALYNKTSIYYDRLNDSCAHSVLKCLNIPIPFSYALSTQTALALIIEHFKLNSPSFIPDPQHCARAI